MRETPTITNSTYSSTSNSAGTFLLAQAAAGAANIFPAYQAGQQRDLEESSDMATRIVRVFVSDPDDSLPISNRVLYQGEEKLTDLTDQELFFELPIGEMLTKHNDVRIKTKDKDQSRDFGRDVMLEPIKIRDLKMVIVNVAALG